MSIKHKHYPHPVLESQFNTRDTSFVDSHFDVSLNVQLEENGAYIIVESIFDLDNSTLNKLIVNGEAVFALLFICESTSIRTLKCLRQFEGSIRLSTKSLNNTVTIRPYIIADKDIKDYQNTSLLEPINEIPFKVKRGDVLAISNDTEVYIEKEKLINVESIFEFIELKGKSAKLLSFYPNNTKIKIFIPNEIYNKVRTFSNYRGSISNVLISLFYVPAVVQALYSITSLIQDPAGEAKLLEYKDYSWYRTLEKKLLELKLGDDLSNISEVDVNSIAHELMENPNYKALSAIDDLIYGSEEV